MAPLGNRWRYPPGMACSGLLGRPGAHPSESYVPRIAPVTFLSLLIQIRSSMRPRAPRSVEPATVFEPFEPTTFTQRIRPETLRWIAVKSCTVPMFPVYGASFEVTESAENDTFHTRAGFEVL